MRWQWLHVAKTPADGPKVCLLHDAHHTSATTRTRSGHRRATLPAPTRSMVAAWPRSRA